jgi:hypothetical protein
VRISLAMTMLTSLAVPEFDRVAQWERASAFEAESCRVEPCRSRQQRKPPLGRAIMIGARPA